MNITPGHMWRGIGYGLTAAWMIGILIVTDNDPAHPLFNYLFIVPLVGWIVIGGLARLLFNRPPPRIEPERDRDRDEDHT